MEEKIEELLKRAKLIVETDKNLGIDEYAANLNKGASGSAPDAAYQNKQSALDSLKEELLKCQECVLHKTRTNLVFGEGHPNAQLMFVGEAPGRQEDIEGRPFVGRAGQLLTKIINAMHLKRNQVYIANILKDRPPNNRNPQQEEIAACKGYLEKQIDIIEPRVICALGTFAAQVLLEVDTPISKLRGKFYDYRQIKFMPTYHPAYLLRNPKEKKVVWEDMKKIMAELGLKP